MTRHRNSIILGLVAALSACGPLVKIGEDGPPPARFSLAAVLPAAASAPSTAALTLRIDDIEAPQELALDRLVVRNGTQQIEYLKDMRWTDKPTRLMRPLLAEHVKALRPEALIMSATQLEPAAQYQLSGRLVAFQVQRDSGKAIVRMDVLLQSPRSKAVFARSFTSEAPTAVTSAASMAAGINTAANAVAADIAAWVAASTR